MQKCSKEGAGDKEDEKMKRSEECKMTHVILHTKIKLTQLFLFFFYFTFILSITCIYFLVYVTCDSFGLFFLQPPPLFWGD